jgi:hypothetical protein
VLFQRLACGHMGVAGMTVASDSNDYSTLQCAECSPLIDPLGLRPANPTGKR